jgi:hypothetical protein
VRILLKSLYIVHTGGVKKIMYKPIDESKRDAAAHLSLQIYACMPSGMFIIYLGCY